MRVNHTISGCIMAILLVSCRAASAQPTPALVDSDLVPTEGAPATGLLPTVTISASPTSVPPTTEAIPPVTATAPSPILFPTPTYSNQAYVPDGHNRQVLDVYLPVGVEGPFPTILTFHGGGFRARSKSLYTPIATHFTDQGYALVASNYRFALADTPYPAQVEDAFCALGWIYSQAEELGFDTSRIFIMGDSAGGYLAAMLGTVETPGLYRGACPHEVPETGPIRGVVVLYGFYDLLSLEGHPPETIEGVLKALMGAPHAEVSLERLEEMSPKSWIDGSEPPFMVVHGTRDRLLASWLSEEFAAALEAAGVQVTLLLIEAQHGFAVQPDFSPPQIEALTAIDAFLGSYSGVGP